MGYPPRVCFPGAIYHVTVRGDNREPVFVDDADHQRYLHALRRYKKHFRFTLHAFALMTNHVHLLLEPAADTTVSRIMQCLAISYTRYFNQRWTRVGHVFQGRFHSRLVQEDGYLVVASRYIHMNPVRAGIVSRPEDYAWSSYPAYVDATNNLLQLTDPETVLGMMSPDPLRQRVEYRAFVEMALLAPVSSADHLQFGI